jgi:hypothetical protein
MPKKINILITEDELLKIPGDFRRIYPNKRPISLIGFITREAQKKMWNRLIELGMISEHHDNTDWERLGHSPNHSPFCRWCRIKKELGIKDD